MSKNYTEAQIKTLHREREERIGTTDIRVVTLGATINGEAFIAVAGHNDDVWVTEQERSAYTVKRGKANIADVWGTQVKIGKEAGNTYYTLLEKVQSSPQNPTGSTTTAGTTAHAIQHAMKRRWREDAASGDMIDPAFIIAEQISDLLIAPFSGFICQVLPGLVRVNGKWVEITSGTTFTVDSGQVPAGAGDAVLCLVEMDEDGAFHLSYGSDYAEPVLMVDALANAPATTPGRLALGYIWMADDTTALTWKNIKSLPLTERLGLARLSTSALNISATPTAAELDAEFGSASDVGDGFVVSIDDNGGGANTWLVWAQGGAWWGVAATELT